MISKTALSSKITILALLGLLVFLGNIKFKQWKDKQEIEKEKQNLLVQADLLQKKNTELSQSLQYLNSPSFKERVARQQLGLKKDGETIYSFGETQVLTSAENTPKESNTKKWWNYFFSLQ
jgi:cell division protein DivIC